MKEKESIKGVSYHKVCVLSCYIIVIFFFLKMVILSVHKNRIVYLFSVVIVL